MPRFRHIKGVNDYVVKEHINLCMQYPTFIKNRNHSNEYIANASIREAFLIESTVRHVCPDEPEVILLAVTEGKTFVNLKTYHSMRMGEARFYRTLNKFYVELAKRRKRIE